jgi:hypothetical protein
VKGFLEIGSHKLFAQAACELWSSWVARITGMSHQWPAYREFLHACSSRKLVYNFPSFAKSLSSLDIKVILDLENEFVSFFFTYFMKQFEELCCYSFFEGQVELSSGSIQSWVLLSW